jgi:hypothetical protein
LPLIRVAFESLVGAGAVDSAAGEVNQMSAELFCFSLKRQTPEPAQKNEWQTPGATNCNEALRVFEKATDRGSRLVLCGGADVPEFYLEKRERILRPGGVRAGQVLAIFPVRRAALSRA